MSKDNTETSQETSNMDLQSFKIQSTTMKRNISNMKTKIEKDGSTTDYTILECRLQILESYFKQINYIQTQIERLDQTDSSRSDLEDLFITAKSLIVNLLHKKRRSSDVDQSFLNITNSTFSHQNRLSQLKLPKFDGKYAEYSRFMSTFNKLVHEETCISTIDKYGYLLNCLEGQAFALVEHFEFVEDNYQKVLYILKQRYDNKALIFIDNINSTYFRLKL